MRRASLTFVFGVAIAFGPRSAPSRPARSRSSTGRPRASSIARFQIRKRSRKRRRRSRPTRAALPGSSTSASRSRAPGSSAKRLRRSREGSKSSRTTRCCCDGAGIGICQSVNSIGPWPISRAAVASTARSTASGITSGSSSTCAESFPRQPRRLPGRSPSPRMRASWPVPPTGCGCRSAAPVVVRKRKRCSIAGLTRSARHQRIHASPAALSWRDRPGGRAHACGHRRGSGRHARLRPRQLVPHPRRQGAGARLVRTISSIGRMARLRVHSFGSGAAATSLSGHSSRSAPTRN